MSYETTEGARPASKRTWGTYDPMTDTWLALVALVGGSRMKTRKSTSRSTRFIQATGDCSVTRVQCAYDDF
jgi:hypothetical protein